MAKHPVTSKKHIRVTTPITEDGITIALDPESEKPLKKTTVHPLTAKPHFESLNNRLPKHLKHKIEEVAGDMPEQPRRVGSGSAVTTSANRQQLNKAAANLTGDHVDDDDEADDEGAKPVSKMNKAELTDAYFNKFQSTPPESAGVKELKFSLNSGTPID